MFNVQRKMKKKGNLFDVVDTGAIVLSVVFILFIMFTVNSKFSDTIKLNNATNNTDINNNMDELNEKYVAGWDYGILIIAIMFPLFSFLASRLIPTDTKYMVLMFFILAFIFVILMILSNIYGAMMDNALFQTFDSNTKFIHFLMPKLPIYGIIYIIIVLVGLFSKSEQ